MSIDELVIKGARQNNLKNISLTLPHNRVIAVTGVSGSGKSSLAFETIFAEGQWRFLESLSTYARLFIEKMDRPKVDSIDNIRPAIALEQRNPMRSPRSTVGTLTEIYDFFRLLYSKAATPYCPDCGLEIRSWDTSAVRAELVKGHSGERAVIIFESAMGPDELRARGFRRVWSEGGAVDFDETESAPPYEVVLDRLIIKDEPRLSDSLETAFREGHGRLKVVIIDGPALVFSLSNACGRCGRQIHEPLPLLFSFNHPVGACPECKGFGNVLRYAEELIVPDPYLSLAEGAIGPWEKPAAGWWKKQMLKGAGESGIDVNLPYREISPEDRMLLFKGNGGFHGIDDFFEELEGKRYKLYVRVFLSRYRKGVRCPFCGGRRLSPDALAYRLDGLDIAGLTELTVSGLIKFFAGMDLSPFRRELVREPLRQIALKLDFLHRVGLDYLTLSREGKTLSGGEYQRVNLSNQLASRLTGTLYVLDEPTVGLHRRDIERVTGIMAELAGIGNTVVVVEHDRGVIAGADWVVELGPGGGDLGGDIVFSGPMEGFLKADTITSDYIRHGGKPEAPRPRRRPEGHIVLYGAEGHNLKRVRLEVPLNTLCVVTGVSGSGKSSLVIETLYRALIREMRMGVESPLPYTGLEGHERLKAVKLIDQAPIGRSPRSNPITYLKVFDPIRRLFAAQPEAMARGYGPGFFSFNVSGGRCPTCKGEGCQRLEMYFFEDLYVRCEDCGGRRYGHEALGIKYMGRDIDEVLRMTVDEALGFFSDTPQVRGRLSLMRDIGMGYLRLGQPATTLSGGEAQRLKLCAELGVGRLDGVLYILDEPTVGLHHQDVGALMGVLDRLVDAGNTVLIIEHNLEVIASADWVMDLGPEGGDGGGKIIFSGPPEELVKEEGSYTGRYLREALPTPPGSQVS